METMLVNHHDCDESAHASHLFIAYIALGRAGLAPAERVIVQVKAMFPRVPMAIAFAGPITNGGVGWLLTIEAKLYTVMMVEEPLPRDAYETALALDRIWPGAEQAMQGHRAHLIVACNTEPKTHGDAMEIAFALSMVISALTVLTDSSAVIWANGDVISEPAMFREAVDGVNRQRLPIDRWIGLTWLDGPPTPTGARTLAALTTGLAGFIGRELEWLPTALPPVTIAERLIGTCQYLIVQGAVIKDGDTLGISREEQIRVRLKAAGQRPGIPVMQLTLERLAATPPPLPPRPTPRLAATPPPLPPRPAPRPSSTPVARTTFGKRTTPP